MTDFFLFDVPSNTYYTSKAVLPASKSHNSESPFEHASKEGTSRVSGRSLLSEL